MGRIAEALKRAEQERAWRLGEETAGGSEAALPSGPGMAVEADPADADSEPGEAFIAVPETRRPFITHANVISPASVDPSIVALHDPGSVFAERYRSVRTRLLTANPGGGSRLHAVSSSIPGEGKTLTAANLAFSMAELRHLRVSLIDLDFRKRGLGHLLGATDRPGVSEVIRGEKSLSEVCIPLVRPNLHFIPAGDVGRMTTSELLSCERVGALFREIGERFHYGLIDTPPIHTVADIGLIAPLCHSVLMVVRMNGAPEPLVRRCVRMLQANQVPIVGSILTGDCDEAAGRGDTYDYYQASEQED